MHYMSSHLILTIILQGRKYYHYSDFIQEVDNLPKRCTQCGMQYSKIPAPPPPLLAPYNPFPFSVSGTCEQPASEIIKTDIILNGPRLIRYP